ncbi:hypothetical protein D3C80_1004450 [compost metagenome]
MSKKVVVLASALALLAGCDGGDAAYPDEEQAYVDEQAGAQTRQQLAEDEKDRQAALKELQAQDPSVKDVYFTMDENGKKQMHVVREEANGQSSDSVWPMVASAGAGALGGYLLAKAMTSSGGVSQYQQQHQPLQTTQCDNRDERRKCKNGSSAGYMAAMMNQNRAAVRAQPNYRQNMNNRVSQWRAAPSSAPATVQSATQSRAKAVFANSGSSARASSHGSSS